MYTSNPRRLRPRIAWLLLALSGAATPAFAADDEPPPFSPSGSFMNPGQFAHTDGATLYRAVCQGCHMPDARGAQGAGMYPALAANPRLALANYPAMVLLQGRRGMPSFRFFLSDAQIAEVVNFVRSHFDNHYTDTLTQADVTTLRASLSPARMP